MSEIFDYENSYEKLSQKVLDCVSTVWLTPFQIYDIYLLKNRNHLSLDNVVLQDIEFVLENLYDDQEIFKNNDPRFGVRYSTSGSNNIVPFTRKLSFV
jgi:hypothetical protein